MRWQFTHPAWLLALPLAVGWIVWLFRRSYVQTGPWRRRFALGLRLAVALAVLLALAGLRWLRPLEGLNVYYLLDRSDSIPSVQQEAAREYVNRSAALKRPVDQGGLIVFGDGAAIETTPHLKVEVPKIHAVIGPDRTDIASAVRLGSAAFPENGQKRLVLLSDGHENAGNVRHAVAAARSLGASVDVVALGALRRGDSSIQRVAIPAGLKKGQTFEVKIFAQSDQPRRASLRLFRNDQLLGEQPVDLAAGKNLFTFPQTLTETGFYTYDVQMDAPGDPIPQNNRAVGFANVRGDPRILIVSAAPEQDEPLQAALRDSRLDVRLAGVREFPASLTEMQSYDAIFLSNVAAGDLGDTNMKLLESAVRDFGVGLVCLGGDQAYAAGGYRGTALESTLPVDMELSSKKILPNGAVVLVMHGMEFMNGNEVARQCALGVLDALGPQDEMGVVLWDGRNQWLFPLAKVGAKKEMARQIAGMNQGDLPTFEEVMSMAHTGLKASSANIKHIIVFSDGDPGAPSARLMASIASDRITVSTVMIAGHSGPNTMIKIADEGRGRFYDVTDPNQLPQIFLKEAMVVLKSAIVEDPFTPQVAGPSQILRGIPGSDLPPLRGYVCSTPKGRAEVALVSDKGDPILAHWQYGLGRAVAWTSDAKARWAQDWQSWPLFRQFWAQTALWSLRRLDPSDLMADVSVEKGEGTVTVEALDAQGEYRNFLHLQAAVLGPTGKKQTVQLEQTGPGRYEGRFAARDISAREVGAYLVNLMEVRDGRVVGAQTLGTSVNYSPEFEAAGSDMQLLSELARLGGGRLLALTNAAVATQNPFLHDRQRTFQPRDLWEWLLKIAVLAFVVDVGVRRIYLDRAEWLKATVTMRRYLLFWQRGARPAEADESLAALLARRDRVRLQKTAAGPQAPSSWSAPAPAPVPGVGTPAPPAAIKPAPAPSRIPAAAPADRGATAGRLLEAKRRAAKRLDR